MPGIGLGIHDKKAGSLVIYLWLQVPNLVDDDLVDHEDLWYNQHRRYHLSIVTYKHSTLPQIADRVRHSSPDCRLTLFSLVSQSSPSLLTLFGASASEGGEGGIRTLDTVTRITVFETVPFNHSGTSPGAIKVAISGASALSTQPTQPR